MRFAWLIAFVVLSQQALASAYLALGDSYTIGESVAEQKRWPVQLAARLAVEYQLALEPLDIVAHTGWTSAELLVALRHAPLKSDYAMVTVQIGVNDQFRQLSADRYRQNLDRLLRRAIALAAGDARRVFLLSIPDYAFTSFGAARSADTRARISAEIDRFNRVNEELCRDLGVMRFDITDISRRGTAFPQLIAEDGLHPSAAQYRQWVRRIAKPIAMRLQALSAVER